MISFIMMSLERRQNLITVIKPNYFAHKGPFYFKIFYASIDHTFFGFAGVKCWENIRKACKSFRLVPNVPRGLSRR